MHLSGILACIFATITVHHVMTQDIASDAQQISDDEMIVNDAIANQAVSQAKSSRIIHAALGRIKATVEERERHVRTKEDVQLLALVANTILFVAMAEIVNVDLLWQYKSEIISMFLATTVIRALMMGKFAVITNQTTKMTNVNFRAWGVLTFAGIKGGLSIVMLMMIPASFEHLEMFKAVVVGVILLSTFIYSACLIVLISKNQAAFQREMDEEEAQH